MPHLTRLSLRLGSVVFLAIVLLFGTGIFAATQLQQDLLPNISLPAFVAVTPYPGASPDVVDRQVTIPVDEALQGLSDVNTVQSTSASGASIVEVQFNDGTDEATDQQKLSSALDSVRGLLPQGTQPPTVEAFSTSQLPILQYAVYAHGSLGQLASQLTSIALPKLKGLSGVTTVDLTGAPVQQVQVTLSTARLSHYHLSIGQVIATLQQSSTIQSVGTLQQNGHSVPIEVSSVLSSLGGIRNVEIAPGPASLLPSHAASPSGATAAPAVVTAGTGPVRVGQLGTVRLASVPADTITRTNGQRSIGLQVLKGNSADTVTVANAVKQAIPGIEARIGHAVRFQSIQDQATPITDAIASILQEGLLGALFAILVIFVFLRGIRATLVAAISIPLSLFVALIVLWWQGFTLNILTLGAMMVAIGRVVDDSIVVLENISRHVSEGESPLAAAYTGAREIVTAVTASTLTTVAVFLPIAFLTGIAGAFFRPFALTVVAALLASLFVAVAVVPLLASRLLPRGRHDTDPASGVLQRVYIPVIRWATGHRWITVGIAIVFFIGSLTLTPLLRINLLDQSSSPDFPISITMPANATLAQTNRVTQRIEALVRGTTDVTAYQATVGGSQDPFAPPGTVPADPTTASVTVLVKKGTYPQALAAVKSRISTYRGPGKVVAGQAQSSANASSSQMEVDVHASDQAGLTAAAQRVRAALAGVPGLINVTSNLTASKPQYQLVPTARLSRTGLTLQALGALVGQAVNGQVATQVTLPSGQMNVQVQLPPGTANTVPALMRLPVATPGGSVPLATLATLQLMPGPQTINRTNGQRTAAITGTITSNNTQGVQSQVNKALATVHLPAGASTTTGGVFQQLSSVITQFALAILAAIGLVYLIMVATFRSLLKPLILLVSIPFAASGAIIALAVTGTALSLPGMIGLLMLIGIVVTNAIVLLDLVEQYRDRGLDVREALIEGGRHRLRPILMTALATMLALLPLALSGNGGGGFISAPLAVVVIGGLFTSTILTLILVPVLYSLTARFTGQRGQKQLDVVLDEAYERRFAVMGSDS
jgi:HAE1 family hydrophobic/amphiphilic exporter-1